MAFDLNNQQSQDVAPNLPSQFTTLEFDEVSGGAFVADFSGGLHALDLDNGHSQAIPNVSSTTAAYNFAVEPGAAFLYRINGTVLEKIDTVTGATTQLVVNLENSTGSDVAIGPASIGLGKSLFISNGARILELGSIGFGGHIDDFRPFVIKVIANFSTDTPIVEIVFPTTMGRNLRRRSFA